MAHSSKYSIGFALCRTFLLRGISQNLTQHWRVDVLVVRKIIEFVQAARSPLPRLTWCMGAALACLLCACDASDNQLASSPSATVTHLNALIWAPDWPDQMHEIADAFHRAHPDIVVDVQFMIGNSVEENLKPKIATHHLPDIISVNANAYAAELADQGLLAELGNTPVWNNMIDRLKPDWTSQKGRHFGISGGVGAPLIYYNREMFQKAGIGTLPTNFDQLLAACAALKVAGFVPMAWTGAFPNMLANGPFSAGFANAVAARYPLDWKERIASGHLRLDDKEGVDIFARIRLIAQRGYLQPGYMQTGYDEGIRWFSEGRAAMTMQGTWSAGQLMHGKDFHTGVFMPPWNAAHQQIVPVIGSETGFAIGETAHKEAALKFLNFLYDEGFPLQQNKRQNVSPLKHVKGQLINDPQITHYIEQAMRAPLTVGPYYSYLPTNSIAKLHGLLQDVLFNRQTPRQAALALSDSIRNEARVDNK